MDISRIKSNVLDYIVTYNVDIMNRDWLKNIIEGFACQESYQVDLNSDYEI